MEKIPKILYKYRDWVSQHHKALLLKNELFLASPKSFNDPFDCRIPQNLFLLDSPEKIEKYVDLQISKNYHEIIKRGEKIADKKSEFTSRLSDDMENQQILLEEFTFSMQDKHFGILSLSAIWNNILMWSHYADSHNGYCVGFHTDKLFEIESFGKIGPVNYTPKYPEIDPLNDDFIKTGFDQTHSKATNWEYEQEFRFYRLFYPNVPTVEERKIFIKDEIFAEIIIGVNISEDNRTEIIAIAQEKGIPVYQTKKKKFEYSLERELVE